LDLKFLAGRGRIGLGTKDGTDDSGGTDAQLGNGGKSCGDGVGKSQAEIFVLLVVGVGGEGEHGNGTNGYRPGRGGFVLCGITKTQCDGGQGHNDNEQGKRKRSESALRGRFCRCRKTRRGGSRNCRTCFTDGRSWRRQKNLARRLRRMNTDGFTGEADGDSPKGPT
jgi:hypothetical protein